MVALRFAHPEKTKHDSKSVFTIYR